MLLGRILPGKEEGKRRKGKGRKIERGEGGYSTGLCQKFSGVKKLTTKYTKGTKEELGEISRSCPDPQQLLRSRGSSNPSKLMKPTTTFFTPSTSVPTLSVPKMQAYIGISCKDEASEKVNSV